MPGIKSIIPLAYVVHSPSRTAADTQTNYGTGPETYDDDFSTYYGVKSAHSGDGNTSATVVDEHTWTSARTIARVRVKGYQNNYGGNYKNAKVYFDVYLRISGVWTNIESDHQSGSFGSNSDWEYTHNFDDSTGWDNVTGIRYELYGYAYSYEGNRNQYVTLWVYESQAFYSFRRSYSGVVT